MMRRLVVAAALLAALVACNDDSGDDDSAVYYKSCDAAQKAGAAPLHRGDPGYRTALDRDGDGVACDS